ncbi:MAG: single-stranded-DNA-specific exonuclease RecJ [Rhodospirillales bacterium]
MDGHEILAKSRKPETAEPVTGDVVLGVGQSFSGRRWLQRRADPRLGLALSQRFDLPEIVGRILAGRGIGIDEAEAFLEPRLRDALPDPSRLRDMDRAAERLAAAIRTGEQVCVFGDYDVDGATSTALLIRFLRAAGGAEPRTYIPDRLTEGYGPNALAMRRLADDGCRLVVTVDCGTLAFDALAAGTAAGLDIIVVDHHAAEPVLPQAYAVVNPNRLDEEAGDLGHLAAVGVAFLLVVATNRALRRAGWYGDARAEPDVRGWLDLVALGTVCDVVALTGLNRAFVAQGLKVMHGRANAGLRALADVAGLDEAAQAYHLGFLLGPRINAGGRVGKSYLGSALLAEDDPDAALSMALQLNAFNAERQEIEARVLAEAADLALAIEPGPLVLVAGRNWHPGVVGIVASRLKDRFQRPACVISLDEDGGGQGSARSLSGIDLGAGIIAARQAGILEKGGGHAMAAGFSLRAERLEDLRSFLAERFARTMREMDIRPTLHVDGALECAGVSLELAETLERLGPFGAANPEPRFVIPGARLLRVQTVGAEGRHIKATAQDRSGKRVEIIAFRAMESDLGPALLAAGDRPLHLLGRLKRNAWMGRVSMQLQLEDAAGMTPTAHTD